MVLSALSRSVTWHPTPRDALILILAVASGLRLAVALHHDGYMGVDGGAYLLSLYQSLGTDATGNAQPHPPLAPGLLLWPFVAAFGTETGLKLFHIFAHLAPLLPFYLLARHVLLRAGVSEWAAVFATLWIAVDISQADAFEAGPLPFLAFGGCWGVIWGMLKLWESASTTSLTVVILGIPFIALTNQTTAGLALFILPATLAALAWHSRTEGHGWTPARRVLLALAAGGTLALVALPWYIPVAFGSDMTRFPGPLVYFVGWGNPPVWQAAIALPFALWTMWRGVAWQLRAVASLVPVIAFLNLWHSNDEALVNVYFRSGYFLAYPTLICVAYVVWRWWLPMLSAVRGPTVLAGAAVLVFLSGLWLRQVDAQAGYTDRLTPSGVVALEYLREHNTAPAVITGEFSLANWVAGVNRQRTVWTTSYDPPDAWRQMDMHVRCVLGWYSMLPGNGCDPLASAQWLQAEYVLADLNFPNEDLKRPETAPMPKGNVWEYTAQMPWLELVYAEGHTRLWRIDGAH